MSLVPDSTIKILRTVMPGQPLAWYERIGQMIQDGLMPMPIVEQSAIVETYRVQPQQPTTSAPRKQSAVAVAVAPAKPKDTVSEETKALLLEICKGNMASAERLVSFERRGAYSEEDAWKRAYEKARDEQINLYAKIGFYS